MNVIKKIVVSVVMLCFIFSFNSLAMQNETGDYVPYTPMNEKKQEDRLLNYRWTWLDDNVCVRFNIKEHGTIAELKMRCSIGELRHWGERAENGSRLLKTRDTYAGKWSQDSAGTWSFTFDDYTIPVGVTKIDGVLYAFNAFGELKDGYNYWGDLKTAADGLVVSEDAEFLKYLEAEYLPECTSHE